MRNATRRLSCCTGSLSTRCHSGMQSIMWSWILPVEPPSALVAVIVAVVVTLAVPVMVVADLAPIAIPVASIVPLSIMTRFHPACAVVRRTGPVAIVPPIVVAGRIPVAPYP